MALFKVLRGDESNLPTLKNDGWAYFCSDTGNFYIDHLNSVGATVRTQINSDYANGIRYKDGQDFVEISALEISIAMANMDSHISNKENPHNTTWESLSDKPFGVVGGRNTITWAGNPGSFERTQPGQWVKVSDAVVTEADITEGANISWFSENQYDASERWITTLPYSVNGDTIEVWATEALYGGSVCVAQFRPNGVFFTKLEGVDGDTYPVSITLPDYGKFPVVKPLEGKYLPEALQFGDVPGSDTWRKKEDFIGSITGTASDNFFKISDAIVTMEDLALGFTMQHRFGDGVQSYSNDQGGAVRLENGIIEIPFIDETGNSTYGVRCYPEGLAHDTGIYVHYVSDDYCIESLTIHGFDGFSTTKTIDKKYLPKADTVQIQIITWGADD